MNIQWKMKTWECRPWKQQKQSSFNVFFSDLFYRWNLFCCFPEYFAVTTTTVTKTAYVLYSLHRNVRISIILTGNYVTDDLNTVIFVISGSKLIITIFFFFVFLNFLVERFFCYFWRPYWIKDKSREYLVAIPYKGMSWRKKIQTLKKIEQ